MNLSKVIIRPIVTEKTAWLMENNVYTFEVAKEAGKRQIKQAIEKFFSDVKVEKVKTMIIKGKSKRVGRTKRLSKKRSWKKAMIWLKEGSKIDILPAGTKK